jgi:hypothetical protein
VVEERGEPFLLPVPCGCPYAIQRHAFPVLRPARACPVFPLVPALGSPGSAAGCPALFVGFTATMAGSDLSRPFIIGYGSSPSRCGPVRQFPAGREISRFPVKERPYMPGSWTSPDRPGARANAPVRVAFRGGKRVGVRGYKTLSR